MNTSDLINYNNMYDKPSSYNILNPIILFHSIIIILLVYIIKILSTNANNTNNFNKKSEDNGNNIKDLYDKILKLEENNNTNNFNKKSEDNGNNIKDLYDKILKLEENNNTNNFNKKSEDNANNKDLYDKILKLEENIKKEDFKNQNLNINEENLFMECHIIERKRAFEASYKLINDQKKCEIEQIYKHFNLNIYDLYKLYLGYSIDIDQLLEDLYSYNICIDEKSKKKDKYINFSFDETINDHYLKRVNKENNYFNSDKIHSKKLLNINYNIILTYPAFNNNKKPNYSLLRMESYSILIIDDIRKVEIKKIEYKDGMFNTQTYKFNDGFVESLFTK